MCLYLLLVVWGWYCEGWIVVGVGVVTGLWFMDFRFRMWFDYMWSVFG